VGEGEFTKESTAAKIGMRVIIEIIVDLAILRGVRRLRNVKGLVYLRHDLQRPDFFSSQSGDLVHIEALPGEVLQESDTLQYLAMIMLTGIQSPHGGPQAHFGRQPHPPIRELQSFDSLLEHNPYDHDLEREADNEHSKTDERRVSELVESVRKCYEQHMERPTFPMSKPIPIASWIGAIQSLYAPSVRIARERWGQRTHVRSM
jgi:hypothetical protein